MRWSCAVVYTNALGGRNVLIGGFDHDEQDMNVAILNVLIMNPR